MYRPLLLESLKLRQLTLDLTPKSVLFHPGHARDSKFETQFEIPECLHLGLHFIFGSDPLRLPKFRFIFHLTYILPQINTSAQYQY